MTLFTNGNGSTKNDSWSTRRESSDILTFSNGVELTSQPLEPGAYDAVVVATAHSGIDYAALVADAIARQLEILLAMVPAERLDARYGKFRQMGRLGQAFQDVSTASGQAE